MSSPAKPEFYVGRIFGSLLGLLIFAFLTGFGIRFISKQPKLGWSATILFGTMCVVTVFDIVREVSLDQDQIPDVKSQLSIRRALVAIGVTVVTLFLGLADEFIPFLFSNAFPRPGVWVATFVTTLAFYPLREEKHANLKMWIPLCAIMGVASIFLSYVKDWLVIVLT